MTTQFTSMNLRRKMLTTQADRRSKSMEILTLWVSADILVTPGTLKSTFGTSKPAFSMNGTMNPPRQQSVCTGILYLLPSCE